MEAVGFCVTGFLKTSSMEITSLKSGHFLVGHINDGTDRQAR